MGWQPENTSLHLHSGEAELGHFRDQLQAVCAAGGGRGTDFSAQQHAGGGESRSHAAQGLKNAGKFQSKRERERELPSLGRRVPV